MTKRSQRWGVLYGVLVLWIAGPSSASMEAPGDSGNTSENHVLAVQHGDARADGHHEGIRSDTRTRDTDGNRTRVRTRRSVDPAIGDSDKRFRSHERLADGTEIRIRSEQRLAEDGSVLRSRSRERLADGTEIRVEKRFNSDGSVREERSELRTDAHDDRPERAERADRPERPERPERADRPERPERPERAGR